MPAPFPIVYPRLGLGLGLGLWLLLALPGCNGQAMQAGTKVEPGVAADAPESESAPQRSSDGEDADNILLNPHTGFVDPRTLEAITPAGDPALAGQPVPLPPGRSAPLPLNPNPKRQYRMAGRMPDTLDVEVESRYFPFADDTDECIAYLQPFKDVLPERTLSITAPERVMRTKDGFEASIVIDRFEDSPCQFVYRDTAIRVYRKADQLPSPDGERRMPYRVSAIDVVTADGYFKSDDIPICMDDRHGCKRETWQQVLNFDPAKPVYVLCKRSDSPDASYGNIGGIKDYLCYGPPRPFYKRMHGLKAHTRSPIRLDIYDLDTEAPPFPVEYSRQPTQGATQ